MHKFQLLAWKQMTVNHADIELSACNNRVHVWQNTPLLKQLQQVLITANPAVILIHLASVFPRRPTVG